MRRLHDPESISFASDNYAGVLPELLEAIAVANGGHEPGYGADAYTQRLQEVVREHFGERAEAYPVFNGTGANVLALQTLTERWDAVVCTTTAHINTDEAAAPERVGGLKLLTVDSPDGKLTPELIDKQAWGWGDQHRAQPAVVSIAQVTELGTVYTPAEIADIVSHAHKRGMSVHMDGARLANAAAALGMPLREFTTDVGVDIVSFGGTKNGMLVGEAVVVLEPESTLGVEYLRKADMQLGSKLRFISAQLVAMLEGELWLNAARQSNDMAGLLRQLLEDAVAAGDAPGLAFTQPTESNAVFATLPKQAADLVRQRYRFYDWDAARGEVRWMTAWDTREEHVEGFVAEVLHALASVE